MHNSWHVAGFVALSYFLSIGAGHFIVVGGLNLFLGRKREGKLHPAAWGIGIIERFIYTSCILLGLPFSAIGAWLVLKGLAQFYPRGTKAESTTTDEFLTQYYSYLMGTGLSLICGTGFGFLGRLMIGLKAIPAMGG